MLNRRIKTKKRDLHKVQITKSLQNGQEVKSDDALAQSDASNLDQHNDEYTKLLKAYVEDYRVNSKNKRKHKESLYKIAISLLLLIPIAVIGLIFIILYLIALDRVTVLEVLVELISALTVLFGTYIIIPKMIIKYLFNKKEEEHLAVIIDKIQEYDKNIRKNLQ